MKYRKKPVVVDAVQFVKGNEQEISDFVKDVSLSMGIGLDNVVTEIGIPTLEGVMTANIGDWIIKGVKGEFYPCKPDIFNLTYERADKPTSPNPLQMAEWIEEFRSPSHFPQGIAILYAKALADFLCQRMGEK